MTPCRMCVKLPCMDYRKEVGALTAKRDAEIAAMRKRGATMQEIADAVGLTRQRIHQILQSREGAKK